MLPLANAPPKRLRCSTDYYDRSVKPDITSGLLPSVSSRKYIVAFIDEREVIERILRYLGLWEEGTRLNPARAPPAGEGTMELFPGGPFPDYNMDPVMDYDVCANA